MGAKVVIYLFRSTYLAGMNDKLIVTPYAYSIIWTFGACLGIYLIAYGTLSLASEALRLFGKVLGGVSRFNVGGLLRDGEIITVRFEAVLFCPSQL